MTNDQINIAIAEACPMLCIKGEDGYYYWGKYVYDAGTELIKQGTRVSFCTDLNAMAEAEKTLTVQQQRDYVYGYLINIADNHRRAYMATARQRAEAFIAVMASGMRKRKEQTNDKPNCNNNDAGGD